MREILGCSCGPDWLGDLESVCQWVGHSRVYHDNRIRIMFACLHRPRPRPRPSVLPPFLPSFLSFPVRSVLRSRSRKLRLVADLLRVRIPYRTLCQRTTLQEYIFVREKN